MKLKKNSENIRIHFNKIKKFLFVRVVLDQIVI